MCVATTLSKCGTGRCIESDTKVIILSYGLFGTLWWYIVALSDM